MDIYQNLSIDYDALNPKEEIFKQELFFKNLIKEYSIKSCLDCSCGTGWHLYMLYNLKISCYGSDISNSMLVKARQNLSNLPITLKNVDFKNLSKTWDEKFDMIICMSTSFPHNSTIEEAIQTLNAIFECLHNKGIVVIDNGFSDFFFKNKPKLIPARIHKNQAFYFFLEYPKPENITVNILNIKKTINGFNHTFETVKYLAIGEQQFIQIFEKSRFTKVEFFGDYNFTPYSKENSKRVIIIAQK